jgi:hypothetical protein
MTAATCPRSPCSSSTLTASPPRENTNISERKFKDEAGPPGPQGNKGDKGDPGTRARLSGLVAAQSSTASCEADEVMISAYCSGTFNAYPLVPLENGARCGNNPRSTTLRVTIVCAKR